MLKIDGKLLSCNEYLDEPTLQEDEIPNKKCTFSYVEFQSFDEVGISSAIAKEVNYDDEELNEVDVSYAIESVEFTESRFPHLPRDLFDKFANLKTVSCDGVHLTSLSRVDFKKSANLEEFSANSNYIRSLEKMLFNGSNKLQILDLSINEIEDIDRTAFYGLENLKKLLLFDNRLQNLSEDVFEDLTSLEEINLSSNQIRVLDDKLFENCKLLNYFYLNDNRIQHISDKSFSSIKEIKFLELSRNELSELVLNISASALHADHNHLTSVKLHSVGYLSFYNNSISSIVIEHETGVISLNISMNRLTKESLETIVEMNETQYLDLSFNKLGKLNISTFLNMPKLKVLNLQSTNLTEIGYGLFTHQTSLTQLDLSYNKLSSLDLGKLTPVKALTALYIEGNDLKEIDYKNIKTILPDLNLLGFSDNAWLCSYLSSLIGFLEQNKIQIYILVAEKAKSNIKGVACLESEKPNEQTNYEDKSLSVNPIKHHQLLSDRNELRAISGKVEAILRDANETREKFVGKAELANELNMIKSAVASLRQDLHDLPRQSDKSTNSSDVRTVANETMALVRLQYDQKLNGLGSEVKAIEQSINEIKSQLKLLSPASNDASTTAAELHYSTTSGNDDSITKLMITITFIIAFGFVVIYVVKLLVSRKARKFIVRRAHPESESINENIL